MKHTKCSVEGCNGEGHVNKYGTIMFVRGFCTYHYNKFKKNGSLESKHIHTCCSIEGCTRVGVLKRDGRRTFSRGFCAMHYTRFIKYGDPLAEPKQIKGNNITKHPLYGLWKGINQRTSDPNSEHYHRYGGRGIKLCARWAGHHGFFRFVDDMGPRPSKSHSVDRKDVNGDYTPENCRWALPHEQAANTEKEHLHLGVHYYKPTGRWISYIGHGGESHRLGHYLTLESALAARKAAEKRFGIVYSNPKPETSLTEVK